MTDGHNDSHRIAVGALAQIDQLIEALEGDVPGALESAEHVIRRAIDPSLSRRLRLVHAYAMLLGLQWLIEIEIGANAEADP